MSAAGPGHVTPSLQSLPEIVRNFIRDRYLAGVADAEAQYENAVGDEDTLTGALGALISTSTPMFFQIGPDLQIEVQIDYRKLRGRGKNAPESRLGADGVFQIQISKSGCSPFRKGLPFQAKKNWKGRDRNLLNQARDMERRLRGGIAIDYTPRGFTACDIADVIATRGSRKEASDAGFVHPLGQILAHEFLACRVGIEGLYYDNLGESFLIDNSNRNLDLVDTSIAIRGPIG